MTYSGLGCVEITVGDVVQNGIVEQNRVLRHNGDAFPQGINVQVGNLLTVHANATPHWIEKTI